jgi:hypothetical protein
MYHHALIARVNGSLRSWRIELVANAGDWAENRHLRFANVFKLHLSGRGIRPSG